MNRSKPRFIKLLTLCLTTLCLLLGSFQSLHTAQGGAQVATGYFNSGNSSFNFRVSPLSTFVNTVSLDVGMQVARSTLLGINMSQFVNIWDIPFRYGYASHKFNSRFGSKWGIQLDQFFSSNATGNGTFISTAFGVYSSSHGLTPSAFYMGGNIGQQWSFPDGFMFRVAAGLELIDMRKKAQTNTQKSGKELTSSAEPTWFPLLDFAMGWFF